MNSICKLVYILDVIAPATTQISQNDIYYTCYVLISIEATKSVIFNYLCTLCSQISCIRRQIIIVVRQFNLSWASRVWQGIIWQVADEVIYNVQYRVFWVTQLMSGKILESNNLWSPTLGSIVLHELASWKKRRLLGSSISSDASYHVCI